MHVYFIQVFFLVAVHKWKKPQFLTFRNSHFLCRETNFKSIWFNEKKEKRAPKNIFEVNNKILRENPICQSVTQMHAKLHKLSKSSLIRHPNFILNASTLEKATYYPRTVIFNFFVPWTPKFKKFTQTPKVSMGTIGGPMNIRKRVLNGNNCSFLWYSWPP